MEQVVSERVLAVLEAARGTGRKAIIPDDRLSLAQAYAVQTAFFAGRKTDLAGWKIGLTGHAIRDAIGASEPVAGMLGPADILMRSFAAALTGGDHYVEAELVFEIAADLPASSAPFYRDDVAAATGALYIGMELVQSRFASSDLPLDLLVADNCMADRLVVGDKVAEGWDERFAALEVTLHGPGEERVHGSTAAVMGNPLDAVTWLANHLAGRGMALRGGQLVSSGTCTGATLVRPGDRVTADLAGLARATIEFC